ncbi:MAG: methyltransferase domain-containing protein, partial [Actinomycetota bacterium]
MSQSSETTETFQIPPAAAERYEERFVPSVFAEWAPVTLEAAEAQPGDRLRDVACGTGIVARTAHRQSQGRIDVTGVDLNQAMLAVAARVEPGVDWRQGDVGALPFADHDFDVVVCQMAFMFFPDRSRALAELVRVARPGGRLAIVVPAALDAQAAYGPFVDVAAEHTGDDARSLLGTYWNCGDLPAFTELARRAGMIDVT